SGRRASVRTTAALGAALAAGLIAVPVWEPILAWAAGRAHLLLPTTLSSLAAGGDRQGALALLPAYQIGLMAGLWYAAAAARRPRTLALAIGLVALSQLALLIGLGAATAWLGGEPHALAIRAWTLGVPVAIAALLAVSGETVAGDPTYLRFWCGVGERFPSLTGAASTAYYFENEKRLIADALPSLDGRTLLKTDLWDEAKNTRILQWAADQGARVYAIDLSEPIVRQARAAFGGRALRSAVSDVRRLPFGDNSFDAIYSMGTIEHFAETEAAVVELARVLKPGGRLILGVPNRHDPFLRPLMVAVLYRIGLYGYGFEKSYSRRALRAMLERAGLDVRLESGLLFVPGVIRMLDLWCHTRARALTVLTRALIRPFVWLDGRVPAVRRHGYLLASVGVKPPEAGAEPRGTGIETGIEYVIDAYGCDAAALRSVPRLQRLVIDVIVDLRLHPAEPPVWHVFSGEGGITGMVLLSESHLTIHTYPEAGLAALNLYCCRASAEWSWDERLRALLGARDVSVRALPRG
ncbi:MAG: S-adenosylmethionine decarboxylase, partial [Vicinamibacterales bacterium]